MALITYSVKVERRGEAWASLNINAANPMLAAEAAERVVCQAAEGNLDRLADYFANSVQEG